MGAGVHHSDAYAASKVSGGQDSHVGMVEIDFHLANPATRHIKIYSRRDGDGELKFLARGTVPPYVDNRPLLVAAKPELREYKTVFVVADNEVSQFSDEIAVNYSPLV